MSDVNDLTRFQKAARNLFQTPNGKYVLDELVRRYMMNLSALDNVNEQYLRLGKYQLVKDLKVITDHKGEFNRQAEVKYEDD